MISPSHCSVSRHVEASRTGAPSFVINCLAAATSTMAGRSDERTIQLPETPPADRPAPRTSFSHPRIRPYGRSRAGIRLLRTVVPQFILGRMYANLRAAFSRTMQAVRWFRLVRIRVLQARSQSASVLNSPRAFSSDSVLDRTWLNPFAVRNRDRSCQGAGQS